MFGPKRVRVWVLLNFGPKEAGSVCIRTQRGWGLGPSVSGSRRFGAWVRVHTQGVGGGGGVCVPILDQGGWVRGCSQGGWVRVLTKDSRKVGLDVGPIKRGS